jgi:hypothetical protein
VRVGGARESREGDEELRAPLLWVAAAVFGMAAATVTAILGLGAGAIALVLTIPLILRGDRMVAISGISIGFGGLWLAALGGQFASGGALDAVQMWILVGAVPLAIGIAALGVRMSRHGSRPRDVQAH